MNIKITLGNVNLYAKVYDTDTGRSVYDLLPIESDFRRYGDEIYFPIPLYIDHENSREVVDVGDLAYWPEGNSFCIFYGRTLASRGNEIRAASPVNVFGKILGSVMLLKEATSDRIRVEKVKGHDEEKE